jgi:hypothetical protein
MFCKCLHSAASHHADGCHVLLRKKGVLTRCNCRRSREQVAQGPDHLNDALWQADERSRRRADEP